jgi:hypothetical protein
MQPYKDNQREATTLAYIAGLIDGEGSIRMVKSYDKAEWSPKYTPHISFTNTNRESVELVSEFIGNDNIFTHDSGKYGYKGRKICFRVQKSGKEAVANILRKLLPYLLIKKRNAELLIEYAEKFEISAGAGRGVKNGQFTGGRIRTDKENQRREKIYQELKAIQGYRTRRE